MPRISRAIAVDYPHHITQRGNYQQTVFAEAEDYARYLDLLVQYAPQCDLQIWAYCLMPNHVHLVAVPQRQDSLARTLHVVHMQYARYFNGKMKTVGHLWQGRFFSCALDERHLYAAIRYVEQNPTRAGLASAPDDYPWSSARGHITGQKDPVLSDGCFLTETVTDWRRYLGVEQDSEAENAVIKATLNGRPCGNKSFIKCVELSLDRNLTPQLRGRPSISEK
ncbi:MAG: transposase [Syntrophales bacterium]